MFTRVVRGSNWFDLSRKRTGYEQLSEGARRRELLYRHADPSHGSVMVVTTPFAEVVAIVVSP
ncbi:hypothetical protein OAG76_03370 [Rubripirellula sp.]|nr:hypothetical protein [Rubripirellula sp.]